MINVIRQFGNRYLIDPITMTAIGLGGGAILGQLGGQYLAGKQAQALAGSNRLQALATLAQALNKPPEIQDIEYQQYQMPEEYQLVGSYTPEALTDTQ